MEAVAPRKGGYKRPVTRAPCEDLLGVVWSNVHLEIWRYPVRGGEARLLYHFLIRMLLKPLTEVYRLER